MKTNIKMRVTPEQSKQVQKIIKGDLPDIALSYPFLYLAEEIGLQYGISEEIFKKDETEEVDADLFIRTNGTCKETKTEENKMEWIPFSIKEDEDLIRGNDYLVTDLYGERAVMEYRPNVWKQRNIKAYMELPEPYRPKTLKDRLDEAVEKYCYEFSDEEWKDDDSKQYFIAYNFDGECFEIEAFGNYTTFAPYYFLDILKAQSFIDSFTTDELMQIMRGE